MVGTGVSHGAGARADDRLSRSDMAEPFSGHGQKLGSTRAVLSPGWITSRIRVRPRWLPNVGSFSTFLGQRGPGPERAAGADHPDQKSRLDALATSAPTILPPAAGSSPARDWDPAAGPLLTIDFTVANVPERRKWH